MCHHDWDERDARAACRQLEYTIGNYLPYSTRQPCHSNSPPVGLSCRGSCFGRGSQEKGIRNFRCTDADRRLLQCSRSNQADTKCGNNAYAGIVCSELVYQSNCAYTIYLCNSELKLQVTERVKSVPHLRLYVHVHHVSLHFQCSAERVQQQHQLMMKHQQLPSNLMEWKPPSPHPSHLVMKPLPPQQNSRLRLLA